MATGCGSVVGSIPVSGVEDTVERKTAIEWFSLVDRLQVREGFVVGPAEPAGEPWREPDCP